MTDKDPKDMTASELLRWAANGEPYNGIDENIWTCPTGKIKALAEAVTGEWPSDNEIFSIVADKIDAELAEARELSLRQGAELWAKANGWPDFRDGEDFGAWLERCFLPRPRYDDGEPVQIGDKVLCYGDVHTVERCAVELYGGGCLLLQYIDSPEERVKRPAPEVLGADGLPIKVGETVWNAIGEEFSVTSVTTNTKGETVVWLGDCGPWNPAHLTHTPPDTQERIDEDAEKFYCDYFSGHSACETCPASAGELSKKSCQQQQILDLLRRQREYDKRTGGDA